MKRLPPKPIHDDPDWTAHQKTCVELMLSSERYQSATTYREQCHIMYDFLVKTFHYSNRFCARILKVDHKCFEKQIRLPIEERAPGRPTILNNEEISTIFQRIHELHSNNEYPTIKDIQQLIIETCEKDTFNRWPVDYKGNSMYLNIGGWSTDQHPGHENNVTFKIGIKSRDLFNSDDTMNINIVCDSRLIMLKPYAPVKSVTSDDLTVSSTLEYEKAEWYDGDTTFLVPIKVILPEKE